LYEQSENTASIEALTEYGLNSWVFLWI